MKRILIKALINILLNFSCRLHCREELRKCRDRLQTLEKERDTLQASLRDATEANNQ